MNLSWAKFFGNRSSVPTPAERIPILCSAASCSTVTRSVFINVTSLKLTIVVSVHWLGFWQENELTTAYFVSGVIIRESNGSLITCCNVSPLVKRMTSLKRGSRNCSASLILRLNQRKRRSVRLLMLGHWPMLRGLVHP